MKKTFVTGSLQWHQMMLGIRKLKFERAMDKFDIYTANIACAQIKWHESKIKESLKQLN